MPRQVSKKRVSRLEYGGVALLKRMTGLNAKQAGEMRFRNIADRHVRFEKEPEAIDDP